MKESHLTAIAENRLAFHPEKTRTLYEPSEEVRFAVVLFGGVSLAVYINGVVQELLHLVRASAPAKNDGNGHQVALLDEGTRRPLKSTQRVYRQLAMHLPQGESDGKVIRTRFVVDVISGSSAGGINGIFLAKALANDLEIEGLARLWEDEGDLEKLLNDGKSYSGIKLRKRSPASLLNSRRMSLKLIEAFQQLEASRPVSEREPLVEELDLDVTATDLRGRLILVRGGKRKIFERHHRHRFHFKWDSSGEKGQTPTNQLGSEFDPFLAFVARATSSFPFAFEPATLNEIQSVLAEGDVGAYRGISGERWKELYQDYLSSLELAGSRDPAADFARIGFGDGGLLDNKPFSGAIEMIGRRSAGMAVRRKLLYVEPSPEHPENAPAMDVPDAFENIKVSLFDVRSETIREDLERVDKYNQVVNRVWIARSGQQQDISRGAARDPEDYRVPHDAWMTKDLRRMIETYGIGYGPHHRLQVSSFTREVSAILARNWRIRPESQSGRALHQLVKAWRRSRYDAIVEEKDPALYTLEIHRQSVELHVPPTAKHKETENRLLAECDIWWCIRRLRFVRQQVEELSASKENCRYRLKNILGSAYDESFTFDSAEMTTLRRQAQKISKKINLLLADVQKEKAKLDCLESCDLQAVLGPEMHLELFTLLEVEGAPRAPEQVDVEANARLEGSELGRRVSLALEGVLEKLRELVAETRKLSKGLFPKAAKKIDLHDEFWRNPNTTVERLAAYFYRHFEQYDLAVLSLLYGTECQEASRIEVLRISPDDASLLYDQQRGGKPKLAGDALMHFGAFLDPKGRRDDRIWGRLDAAESILEALVPDRDQRRRWLSQLQEEILREELAERAEAAIGKIVQEDAERRPEVATSGFWSPERRVPQDPLLKWLYSLPFKERDRLGEYLMAKIEPRELVKAFAAASVEREALPVEKQMELTARAADVVSGMLDASPEAKWPLLKKLGLLPRAITSALSAVLALSAGSSVFHRGFRGLVTVLLGLVLVLAVILVPLRQHEAAGIMLGLGFALLLIKLIATALESAWNGNWRSWIWPVLILVLGLAMYGGAVLFGEILSRLPFSR